MKGNFFIMTLLIMSFHLFGQRTNNNILIGPIQSDTSTIEKKGYYSGLLKPITQSTHKIELRYFSLPAFENETCYIITFDTSWSINKITYNKKTTKYEFVAPPINLQVDTFFSRLTHSNIFALPDHKNIKPEIWYMNTDGSLSAPAMTVNDGICYKIEFKVSMNYRAYEFCNPARYRHFYKTNGYFKDLSDIVEHFNLLEKD